MWSPNELLKIEKQRDILSYITLQFFHFKKVPLEHCPFAAPLFAVIEVPISACPTADIEGKHTENHVIARSEATWQSPGTSSKDWEVFDG